MNITEYIYLINKPDAVNEKQTAVLEKIVQEFPYFQSVRALYLKGLYNQNSFKYNYVLKVTAAHTTDRSILFDFITSDTFTSVNKHLLEQKLSEISDINVTESEVIEPTQTEIEQSAAKLEIRENSVEQSILSSIKKAGQDVPFDIPAEVNWIPAENETIAEAEAENTVSQVSSTENSTEPTETEITALETPETTEAVENVSAEIASEQNQETAISEIAADTAAEKTSETQSETKLEIGAPLPFSKSETHSFQEWLQLSTFKPIDRTAIEPLKEQPEIANEPIETVEENFPETDLEKQKKNELIDRFIETSPKIPPVKHDSPLTPSIIVEPSMSDNTYLMTETLARVYLEQKKYHKAIQAYEILILKYPEKSSFFADRILDIKNLQQNNK